VIEARKASFGVWNSRVRFRYCANCFCENGRNSDGSSAQPPASARAFGVLDLSGAHWRRLPTAQGHSIIANETTLDLVSASAADIDPSAGFGRPVVERSGQDIAPGSRDAVTSMLFSIMAGCRGMAQV
jgi:hypothetical protein